MTLSPSFNELESLQAKLTQLIEQLPQKEHGELIRQALLTVMKMADGDMDRLDWKILNASLQDMERAFRVFYPYRHTRKITVFGSARMQEDCPEYQIAVEFGRRIAQQGFMVMTGAGGGIMQAANEGAGIEHSIGLNIQLPFEQGANPFIQGDDKLIQFKYFFTRKLFFLKESDALALFPGGFGTQDEAFECLTLTQTGKSAPVPLVLIDRPGGSYWRDWHAYVEKNLLERGLASPEDSSLYTITDDLDVACEAIASFYRVYHSSRYIGNKLVLRMKSDLSDMDVERLNIEFSDILVKGRIEKSDALPQEAKDETVDLPRLTLYFNQRDLGRLYQLIAEINRLGLPSPTADHPEQK